MGARGYREREGGRERWREGERRREQSKLSRYERTSNELKREKKSMIFRRVLWCDACIDIHMDSRTVAA